MKIKKTDEGLYSVSVDEHEYLFEKWGAEAALDCLWDISGMVSAPLGGLIMQMFGKGGEGYKTEITGDIATRVVSELSANMRANKELGLSILRRLAGGSVLCDGKKFSYDMHYADRLPHLFKVVRAAAEVQYGNFFAALQDVAGLRPATAIAPAST